MKYTIKNIISLFFFSITMRVACFVYKYMSEESQKEIGSVFESGLTPRALDFACTCFYNNLGTIERPNPRCSQHGTQSQ